MGSAINQTPCLFLAAVVSTTDKMSVVVEDNMNFGWVVRVREKVGETWAHGRRDVMAFWLIFCGLRLAFSSVIVCHNI